MPQKEKIRSVLRQYWGYGNFRPLQEEIILSVMDGKDTLALLPTGGGKSICFQVPALAMDGICVVVTPLIALMKDQVSQLKHRKINAVAIYSGMHKREIDIALDNCAYGTVKFLYVSPERLQTELFRERLKRMRVCLLAVDEAHCISQWGYDFRPPYMKIAEIRELIPKVPVIALTATATMQVVEDIQEKLLFKTKNVFQKSFERPNLSYSVINEEDKLNKLLRMLNKTSGSAIVYVRNRKKTKETAYFLYQNGIVADFYHAGLTMADRDKKQEMWIKGESRVMVCTNAFGMGIDKPDVRMVVHLDLPDSLEAYFQEAGRAGRDEKKSWAVILYNEADRIDLENYFLSSYPPVDEIKNVYQALGNYLQLAVGSGMGLTYDFDFNKFVTNYQFKPIPTYSALSFLEREGYFTLTEDFNIQSRVYISVEKEVLYRFQIANKNYDSFIKLLLRSYGGMFTDFVGIREDELARRLNVSREEIVKYLNYLQQINMIIYLPYSGNSKLTFIQPRIDKNYLRISPENYEFLKQNARKRLDAVIHYATTSNKCRNRMLLEYFGEKTEHRCGVCDYCTNRNKLSLSEHEFDNIISIIKPILKSAPASIAEIVSKVPTVHEDKVISAVIWLIDNNKINYNDDALLEWI